MLHWHSLSRELARTRLTRLQRSFVDVTSQFDEPSKQVYDGITCDGNEVLRTLDKFQTDDTTAVRIIHKNGKIDVYNGKGAAYVQITDPASIEAGAGARKLKGAYDYSYTRTDDKYINPGATFTGSILRNSDNVITCIVFTQQ
ncbi:MAG: hypothetical protein ACLR6B_11620 [Blautia sp.]